MGAHGFVVRGCVDGDHVVGSDGPVCLLEVQPVLLGEMGTAVGPLYGLPDVPYALLGPVHKDHVCGHLPSSFPAPDPRRESTLSTLPMMPANETLCIRLILTSTVATSTGADAGSVRVAALPWSSASRTLTV